jgi:hypothetical protein
LPYRGSKLGINTPAENNKEERHRELNTKDTGLKAQVLKFVYYNVAIHLHLLPFGTGGKK